MMADLFSCEDSTVYDPLISFAEDGVPWFIATDVTSRAGEREPNDLLESFEGI
jgi:hypothetical protein